MSFKYRKEIKNFKKVLKINPTNFEILIELRCLYQDFSRYKKAIISYKKALEIYPENAEVLNY